ncbi:GEVED domain-containing protein [Anatilimnocola sp. NA78]|uniref:GEVED domain-containing protein n=1 Tax=Anatilimnocola sp. NA78 TaxID=3415683 RepID=UPI003CE5A96F
MLAPLVANPSFEDAPIPPVFPGYTATISGWTVAGGTGINPSQDNSAPFLNGLPVPDGARIGFVQGAGTFTQSVSGFEVGKIYQLTYHENERGNGAAVVQPYARIGAETIVEEHALTRQNAGFVPVTSRPFYAYSTTMTLVIGNDDPTMPGVLVGDNTLLLDNIQITEVSLPVVANHSFDPPVEEISNNPFPGYGPISNWNQSNLTNIGITPANGGSPANVFLNGKTPLDGTSTALLQNLAGTSTSNISQTVGTFVIGQTYVLDYYEAERGQGAAIARPYARIGGAIVVDEHSLTSTSQQFVRVVSRPFVATATTMLLELGNNDPLQAGDGALDNTVLYDRILIRPVANSTTATLYDGGFESPLSPADTFKQANGTGTGTLSGSAWTFANGGGITRNNSAFHNGAISATEGQQFAILQHGASFQQTVHGFVPGNTYNLDFLAARRTSQANSSDTYSVLLDGVPLYTETWTNNGGINQSFTSKSTPNFVATKGSYTIEFNSPDTAGEDETTFIDNIVLNLVSQPDFGDAPDTYATLQASNGPRHAVATPLRLGATIDGEPDGQPSIGATGDGADEDGVTISPIAFGGTTTIVATVNGGPGQLNGWIDWNQDGDFGDAGEQVFTNTAVVNGANTFTLTVPVEASVLASTTTYARFRVNSTGGLASTGFAPDGEVEDYAITLEPTRATVYVDAAFTTPGIDPDGAGPATSVGFDAFPTVTQGLAAVAAGGTIVVNAGTIVDNVTLNKSVTIDGAGTGTTTIQGSITTSGPLTSVTLREYSLASGGLVVPVGSSVNTLNLFDVAGGTGSNIAGTVTTLNLTTTDGSDTATFNGLGIGATLSTNKLNSVAISAGAVAAMNINTFQTVADIADSVTIVPDESIVVNLNAGNPTGPGVGDLLTLDLSGVATGLVFVPAANGTLTLPGRAAINWLSVEDVDVIGLPNVPEVALGDALVLGNTTSTNYIVISRGSLNQTIMRLNSSQVTAAVTGKVVVYGGENADTINASNLVLPVEVYGQGGNDYLAGASGNDLLVGGTGVDTVMGGPGDNTLWGDNVGQQNLVAGSNDSLSGGAGNDVIYGGGGDDRISGAAGNDYAYGGEGSDSIDGGIGDDRLYGGNGNDQLTGYSGNDLISAGNGNDLLQGGEGNDVLIAGVGADNLFGSSGNDLLVAGSVANQLSSTAGDANDLALLALLGTWGSSGSNRSGLGVVTQDTDIDKLAGETGDDDLSFVVGTDIVTNFNAPGMGTDQAF